tara:strand:- start:161 stop:322 length:162 start_codon:yes stop_codon:yes gene_type:complete
MRAIKVQMNTLDKKEWNKEKNCKDTIYFIELIAKINALMSNEESNFRDNDSKD